MISILLVSALVFCLGTIFFLLLYAQQSYQPNLLMSVLGSGGHTYEMLTLVKSLIISDEDQNSEERKFQLNQSTKINEIIFIIPKDDHLSLEKLDQTFPKRKFGSENHEGVNIQYGVYKIQRSRQVCQSYLSSIWTTLLALYDSWNVIARIRPGILLCNGPGVCIPVILASKILSPHTIIVFVESFCRTRTLSLSGKIIYHGNLAHHFMVQWPKLAEKYPKTKFLGLLV